MHALLVLTLSKRHILETSFQSVCTLTLKVSKPIEYFKLECQFYYACFAYI